VTMKRIITCDLQLAQFHGLISVDKQSNLRAESVGAIVGLRPIVCAASPR
jgi:hypothetical protein